MKVVLLSVLIAVVLATALSTGWEIMFRLGYTMIGVMVVSFVWAWGNIRWLRFHHEIKTSRAQVGGSILERLALENTSWLPKLWLEVRDASTLVGRRANRVVALGSHAKRSFTLETPCRVRGEFTLGPITMSSGDPFGLFRMQRRVGVVGTVIVHPAMAQLASFHQLAGELPGGNVRRHRTHYTTPNAAGIREYRPGDALCRIHWPSSVRQQRLMVKEFELDPLSDVWLILDLDREVQAGAGQESTEEVAVSVCATLANYFVRQQRELGVITQGRVLPPDRGDRQLQKALDMLAVVHSSSSVPLKQMVMAEELRFARGATAVVITSSSDEQWLDICRLLAVRGVTVLAVLLEASTFGARRSSLLVVSSLAALGIPTYLVKRGDDLAEALAKPNVGDGG